MTNISDAFTTSGNVEVTRVDGKVHVDEVPTYLTGSEESALREFYQHERDREIGRVRWPGEPSLIIYPDKNDPDVIEVLDEQFVGVETYVRDGAWADLPTDLPELAAAWWFENNPPKCEETAPLLHRRHVEGPVYKADYIHCQLTGTHTVHKHEVDGYTVTWTTNNNESE